AVLSLGPRRLSEPLAISAMFAGGGIAATGRFWPSAAFGGDPVIVGTAVNFLILVLALGAGVIWPARTVSEGETWHPVWISPPRENIAVGFSRLSGDCFRLRAQPAARAPSLSASAGGSREP